MIKTQSGSSTDVQITSWARRMARSALQDSLLDMAPDICSFALGLPSIDLFPAAEYARASENVLTTHPEAFQYGPPSTTLKEHIVALMRLRGFDCNEAQIVLTSGAQQAVYLIVSLLLDPRRQVVVENFSYPGFLQIIRPYNPEFLVVPTDFESGMDVDRVEWYLVRGERPAFIYAISDGHNPLGTSMSVEKRDRLSAIAREYQVPIIEEDPYGFLRYSPILMRPIGARGEGCVFYVGSFSKILAPSLRIGWIVGPERFMGHLATLKESLDIHMATFSQHVVARMLDSGFFPAHIERLRRAYRERRDAMLLSLSGRFQGYARWVKPDCGIFIWLELSNGADISGLVEKAVSEYRVAFLPGPVFAVTGCGGTHALRLNFSYPSVENIHHGMLQLAKLVAEDAGCRQPSA